MELNLIDSSILISYFRKEETQHQKAIDLIDKLRSFAITDYILLEIATVLLVRESREIAQKAVNALSNNESIIIFRLTDKELADTIDKFQRQKNNLSFVDISLLILQDSRNSNLYTFDKELVKASKNK